MSAQVADHVAAVAVFGNPMRNIPGGGPLNELSTVYGAKTIDLCAPDDLFCSLGLSLSAHFSHAENGMTDEGGGFRGGPGAVGHSPGSHSPNKRCRRASIVFDDDQRRSAEAGSGGPDR